MSKPTPQRVIRALTKRDGDECAWHGDACDKDTLVPQHRMGGMGGSKTKHRLSNVVWLCSSINGLIEADADLAQVARERGVKVPFWGDTVRIPVVYADGRTYRLTDDGTREEVDIGAD